MIGKVWRFSTGMGMMEFRFSSMILFGGVAARVCGAGF